MGYVAVRTTRRIQAKSSSEAVIRISKDGSDFFTTTPQRQSNNGAIETSEDGTYLPRSLGLLEASKVVPIDSFQSNEFVLLELFVLDASPLPIIRVGEGRVGFLRSVGGLLPGHPER